VLDFDWDPELYLLQGANDVALEYDVAGRITATTNQDTVTFTSELDAGGRVETVAYVDDLFNVTYVYDSVTGLLSEVSDDLTGTVVSFQYDADRALAALVRSNGVDTAFVKDNAGRLAEIHHSSLAEIQMTRDAVGQITSMDYTAPLQPAENIENESETYTYNAASQINNTGFLYDDRGRVTQDPWNSYVWDGASRLTSISGTVLQYNGFGDLIQRESQGETTSYFYHYSYLGCPIMAERNDSRDEWKRFYVHTPDGRLLYMIDAEAGDEVGYYHFDHLGSTMMITDSTGSATDSYTYTPYGELLAHHGSSSQPFTYIGAWGARREDDSSDLYQMHARYYHAPTGRFISKELIWPATGNPKDLNPYTYGRCNPLSYIDPTGAFASLFGINPFLAMSGFIIGLLLVFVPMMEFMGIPRVATFMLAGLMISSFMGVIGPTSTSSGPSGSSWPDSLHGGTSNTDTSNKPVSPRTQGMSNTRTDRPQGNITHTLTDEQINKRYNLAPPLQNVNPGQLAGSATGAVTDAVPEIPNPNTPDETVPFPFWQHGWGITTFWSISDRLSEADAVVTINLLNGAGELNMNPEYAQDPINGAAWQPTTADEWYTGDSGAGYGVYEIDNDYDTVYLWGAVFALVENPLMSPGYHVVMPGNPYGTP